MRKNARVARDIMSRRLQVLAPHAEIKDAVHALLRKGHSGAPVVDEEGRLLGVFSDYDCVRGLDAAVHSQWPSGSVQSYMTTEVETIPPDMELRDVAKRLIEGRHRRLLVIEDDRLVGLISRRDLLSALENALQEPPHPMSTYEAMEAARG
jgi:CBS domain-containing protein